MPLDPVYLKALPLLRGFSPAEQRTLASQLELVQVQPGELLIAQGSGEDGFFLILGGTVSTTRVLPTGHEITTARLGKGHVVGYLAMLDDKPRSANVRAVTRATLARLDRASFTRLVSGPDALSVRFQRLLAREMIRSLRLANQRFTRSASLPPAEFLTPENFADEGA